MITRNIKSKVFLRQQKKNQKKTQNRLKKSYLVFCLILISSGVTKLGKKNPYLNKNNTNTFFIQVLFCLLFMLPLLMYFYKN